MKDTYLIVIIALFATGYLFFSSNKIFNNLEATSNPQFGLSFSLPSLFIPPPKLPQPSEEDMAKEAWAVFQNYLQFAKEHNLDGIKALSYQISDTCNNPESENACFALMDNLYTVANPLQFNEFKNIQFDDRQVIMSTEGEFIAIIYFVRDEVGTPKILGLNFCIDNKEAIEQCVETDPTKRDKDNNGWWDSVESLFY